MTFFLVHWTQICKIFHLCTPYCGKKSQSKAGSCCSPGFSWVLAFTPSLGYAPSAKRYIYLVIRPKDPSGIHTDRLSPRSTGRQIQLAHDWQANATPLVPFETPLSTSLPPPTPFTCYLITPQYKWTATTRKHPVLTPEMILAKFFYPY